MRHGWWACTLMGANVSQSLRDLAMEHSTSIEREIQFQDSRKRCKEIESDDSEDITTESPLKLISALWAVPKNAHKCNVVSLLIQAQHFVYLRFSKKSLWPNRQLGPAAHVGKIRINEFFSRSNIKDFIITFTSTRVDININNWYWESKWEL